MDFKRHIILVLAMFCLVLNLVLLDAAVSAAENPSCVTDKCHATMGKEAYVHGPVAVNQCTVCHNPTASHEFKAITDFGKLCNMCHVGSHYFGKIVHPPVEKGHCTGCHDPHQSPYQFMLRGEGGKVCFICHDKEFAVEKYIHSPMEACTECHSPHTPWEIPAVRRLDQACYMCHPEPDREIKTYITWHTELYCSTCHHTKHGYKPQCLECHQRHTDTGSVFLDACLACHPPHKARQVVYPADIPKSACAVCHPSQDEILERSHTKHSALRCTKCHPDKHRTVMRCQQCHSKPPASCTPNMLCGQCHGPAHALWPVSRPDPVHGKVQ